MSASYGWVPATDKINSFESNFTSDDWNKIMDNFGELISQDDLTKLRHFHQATGDEIYQELADLVEKVGAIKVRREF